MTKFFYTLIGLLTGPMVGIVLFAILMMFGFIFSIALDGIFNSNLRFFIKDMPSGSVRLLFGIFVFLGSIIGGILGFLNAKYYIE